MEDDIRTPEEKEKKLKELAEEFANTMPEKKTKGQEALETKLKDMTPAQKEQLEKMKQIMLDKRDKEIFKANLRNQHLQKKAAKRAKAAKVARKQRKVNRKRK
jgi:hypothetical protein